MILLMKWVKCVDNILILNQCYHLNNNKKIKQFYQKNLMKINKH